MDQSSFTVPVPALSDVAQCDAIEPSALCEVPDLPQPLPLNRQIPFPAERSAAEFAEGQPRRCSPFLSTHRSVGLRTSSQSSQHRNGMQGSHTKPSLSSSGLHPSRRVFTSSGDISQQPAGDVSCSTAVHRPNPSISAVLETARPAQWKGRGELFQMPMGEVPRGLFLVLDMWSGIGGLLFALLSIGVRCIAVCAEDAVAPTSSARYSFPDAVHIEKVEYLRAVDFRALFRRRKITAVITGGASPCQGNSSLNARRQGWADPRSQGPLHIRRLVQEFGRMQESHNVPCLTFLENVHSMPDHCRSIYNQIMQCPGIASRASRCGWAERYRLYWARGPRGSILDLPRPLLPPDWELVQADTEWELRYTGSKPLPPRVPFEDNFAPFFDPKQVVKAVPRQLQPSSSKTQGGSPPVVTRTRASYGGANSGGNRYHLSELSSWECRRMQSYTYQVTMPSSAVLPKIPPSATAFTYQQ